MPLKPVRGKIESQEINDNFSYLDSIKLGKTDEVVMSQLSQEVKEAMTGGAVPYVGPKSVDSINLRDKAVTPDKTTFIKQSTNLFDKNDVLTGYTIDPTTGNLTPNEAYSASNFAEAEELTSYTFKKSVGWSGRIAFYDASQILISTFPLASETEVRTSTSPERTRYMIMVCRNEDLNIFQVNKGDVVLPYEQYYNQYSRKINFPIDNSNIELSYSGGLLRQVTEKLGSKSLKETELSFDQSGNLLSVTESANAERVQTTLTFNNGVLTAVNRVTL